MRDKLNDVLNHVTYGTMLVQDCECVARRRRSLTSCHLIHFDEFAVKLGKGCWAN